MATAYVVSEGEYSNDIVAVFSTREKAEAFLKRYGDAEAYRDARISEWEIDQLEDADRRTVYECRMRLHDGYIEHQWETRQWRGRNQPVAEPSDGINPTTGFYVVETESLVSPEHAIESAWEYRKAKLALGSLEHTLPAHLSAEVPEHRDYEVLLDGQPVNLAVEANSKDGWVCAYVVKGTDNDGEPLLAWTRDIKGNPTFQTQILRGQVEFRRREKK